MSLPKQTDGAPEIKRFTSARLVSNIIWIGLLLLAIILVGEIPTIKSNSNWVSRIEEPILYWVIVTMFSAGLLYNIVELIRRKIFGLEKCIKCGHLYSSKDSKICEHCGNVRRSF